MKILKEKYIENYSPLWIDFINKLKDVNLCNCPEPHLPVFGDDYENSEYKIAFVGIDTVKACSLADCINYDISDALFMWEEEFSNLEFVDWEKKYNFWKLIFNFLAAFYDIPVEELKSKSKRVEKILKSFIWANVNSIERFEVTSKNKGVKLEDWNKVKEASIVFDSAINIIKSLEPKIIVVTNWKTPNEWFNFGLESSLKFEDVNDNLRYGYIKETETHIFWTKHPRYLIINDYCDDVIVQILSLISKYKIYISYPGMKRNEVLKTIVEDLEIVNKSLSDLDLQLITSDKALEYADSYFYFTKNDWKYGIGFGFDDAFLNKFFFGIRSKEKLDDKYLASIQSVFGLEANEKSTIDWPSWYWSKDEFLKITNNYNRENFRSYIAEIVKDQFDKFKTFEL